MTQTHRARARLRLLSDAENRRYSSVCAPRATDTLNRRLGILEGIARGERAIEEGRVVTHAEARMRMARWLS